LKPPYPVSTDILPYLDEITPDSLKYLVVDYLSKIVLYDSKVTKAEYSKLNSGRYLTAFEVEVNKV